MTGPVFLIFGGVSMATRRLWLTTQWQPDGQRGSALVRVARP